MNHLKQISGWVWICILLTNIGTSVDVQAHGGGSHAAGAADAQATPPADNSVKTLPIDQVTELEKAPSTQDRFETLLQSRNDDYERQRLSLFSDPAAIAYLPQRFNDPDRVVAFTARTLHSWATRPQTGYAEFEEYLQTGLYARKALLDRTALGWMPPRELSKYLDEHADQPGLLDYVLLRTLMRPAEPYVAPAVSMHFYEHAIGEAEVLIRINLESPVPGGFEGLAELSLPKIGRYRALRAINHERSRALRLKQPFPPELETTRTKLIRKASIGRAP